MTGTQHSHRHLRNPFVMGLFHQRGNPLQSSSRFQLPLQKAHCGFPSPTLGNEDTGPVSSQRWLRAWTPGPPTSLSPAPVRTGTCVQPAEPVPPDGGASAVPAQGSRAQETSAAHVPALKEMMCVNRAGM